MSKLLLSIDLGKPHLNLFIYYTVVNIEWLLLVYGHAAGILRLYIFIQLNQAKVHFLKGGIHFQKLQNIRFKFKNIYTVDKISGGVDLMDTPWLHAI